MKSNFILFLFVLLYVGCGDNYNEKSEDNRGFLKTYSFIKDVNSSYINEKLKVLDLNLSVKNDVSSFLLEYFTANEFNITVTASGSIVVPKEINLSKKYPLVIYHHGTVFQDIEVPSYYGTDIISEVLASNGYIVIMPDYLGYGSSSEEKHPYMHKSISNTSIDMLKASKSFLELKNIIYNQLFLTGYSEGAYATLATQKDIEQNYNDEFNITASAPMAGAYDLLSTTYEILKKDTYDNPAFLAYLIYFYNDYYKWDLLFNIFNEQYSNKIDSLFTGDYNAYSINLELSQNLEELFSMNFLNQFQNDIVGKNIENNLKQNSFLYNDWVPISPIKLFHGLNDLTVPYLNTENMYTYLINKNVDCEIISYPGDHYTSAIFLHLEVKKWFDELKN